MTRNKIVYFISVSISYSCFFSNDQDCFNSLYLLSSLKTKLLSFQRKANESKMLSFLILFWMTASVWLNAVCSCIVVKQRDTFDFLCVQNSFLGGIESISKHDIAIQQNDFKETCLINRHDGSSNLTRMVLSSESATIVITTPTFF